MADNAVVPLNPTKKSLIQAPMDTSVPPEIAAALNLDGNNVPSLTLPKPPPIDQASSPDYPVPTDDSSIKIPPIGTQHGNIPPPPPIMAAMGNSTNEANLAAFDLPKPNVLPPKPSLMDKVGKFLPMIGAIGAGLEAAGEPNEPHQGANLLNQNLQALAARRLEQAKLENVEIPEAQAHAAYWQQFNPTKLGVAQTNAAASVQRTQIANRFKVTPVGLYDTQQQEFIPGSQSGVIVTPEIAKDYELPPQFIGTPVKITDLAAKERAVNGNLTTVQGAKGPAIVNKRNATGKDLGLGSPAVTARQAGVVDTVDNSGNVTPMTEAQRLAQGAPLATTTTRVGDTERKIFEPAIEADTRLKQMYQQVVDKTGASDQALLFNHIAMTGGNVKGLRMGTFLTEEHRKARGIAEDVGVLWNRLASGESLSPQQRINFVHLAEQVRQSKWDQAQREAQLQGINVTVPSDPDLPAINPINNPQRPGQPAPQSAPGAGVGSNIQVNPGKVNNSTNKGTVRFVEGSDVYNIPVAKVKAFTDAHPNAKRK